MVTIKDEEVQNGIASEIMGDIKAVDRRPDLVEEGKLFAQATGSVKLDVWDLQWALTAGRGTHRPQEHQHR